MRSTACSRARGGQWSRSRAKLLRARCAAASNALSEAGERSVVTITRRHGDDDYVQLLSDPQLQSRIDALPQRPLGECIDMTHHFDIVSGFRNE